MWAIVHRLDLQPEAAVRQDEAAARSLEDRNAQLQCGVLDIDRPREGQLAEVSGRR